MLITLRQRYYSRKLGRLLKADGLNLAVAESCSGGGLSYCLTGIPGSSSWFECGYVTYSNTAKQEMLGVSSAALREYGAVSAAVAEEMARGVLEHSRVTIACALTGIAGPGGGSAAKPVGTVWFALATEQACQTRVCVFRGSRRQVRNQSVLYALRWLVSSVTAR